MAEAARSRHRGEPPELAGEALEQTLQDQVLRKKVWCIHMLRPYSYVQVHLS